MSIILATSDNHIGFRQYGMLEREKDIEKAFHSILRLASQSSADAITVSGDLLHSTRPTSKTMDFMSHMHEILEEAGIPCLVSSGNHDKSDPHWIEILGNKGDLTGGGFKLIDNKKVDIGNISIYGQPFVSKKEWEEKRKSIPEVDILLMHQSFAEWAFANPDTSFYPKDLKGLKVNTIVMGDTHVTGDCMINNDSTILISPGSSEMISSAEPTDKNVILIHKDDKGSFVHNRLPLMTRPIVRGLVETEEDVEGIIGVIAHNILVADNTYDYPLVYVDYDPAVAYVTDNIRRQWPGIMLRARPKRQKSNNPVAQPVPETQGPSQQKEAEAILSKMLPADTHASTHTLAHELLNPECDVNVRIDDYVRGLKAELDTGWS
jgi:hypothetical protein